MFMQEVLHMQIHRGKSFKTVDKGCADAIWQQTVINNLDAEHTLCSNRVLNHPHESNIGVLYMKTINENLTVEVIKEMGEEIDLYRLTNPMWRRPSSTTLFVR